MRISLPLKFDLQAKKKDRVVYHALFRTPDTREIRIQSTDSYLQLGAYSAVSNNNVVHNFHSHEDGLIAMRSHGNNLESNAIADTFGDLYDRDMERALGKGERR